jgi:hypothetical protein
VRLGRAEVGAPPEERVAPELGERAALRVGIVVEEHRHLELDGDPLCERDGRTRGDVVVLAERDERNDVDNPEAGVHANVVRQIDGGGCGSGERTGCRLGVTWSRTREGEDAPVVIDVGVHVEE